MLVADNRSVDSHLAGGAALHLAPNSKRYSNDLDYFHDSEARVASAFSQDRILLEENGYKLVVQLDHPAFVRAVVSNASGTTKIEWTRDSAWRFMPVERHPAYGYALHPIDLAVNKVLALAGRDEARDLIDVLDAHERILPLPALVWAAPGKDRGYNPSILLSLLRRRSKYQPEDFESLMLTEKVDLIALKEKWQALLEEVDTYVTKPPAADFGCLYYAPKTKNFVAYNHGANLQPHFPTLGGALPQFS